MPKKGQKVSEETREKTRQARARQEAMKFARHGLYARGEHFPEEIRDVVGMVDQVIEELVDKELGGPGNVRPSQWVHISMLRTALVISHAAARYAASRGIANRERHDLESVLKHCGGWHDRVGRALAALGLTGSDGQLAPNVAERLKTIEIAAKQGDTDGSH